MRHNYNIYFLTILITLFLSVITSSCKKFLDVKQNAALVVPTSLDDLQKLLDDNGFMNDQRTPSLGETSSDDYFMTDDYFDLVSSVLGNSISHKYIWQEYFNENAQNDWGTGYQPIYNCNLTLDVLKKIKQNAQNAESWNNIKGSALFYRSYYFLSLLWNYSKAYDASTATSDPGIVLRLSSDFSIPSIRSSNEVCYNKIIDDIKECIGLLPAYTYYKTRPSRAAAYGLLARCYLSMRDYKSALLFADSCLQLESKLMSHDNDDEINPSLIPTFRKANKEVIFHSEMNNNGIIFNTIQGISGIDTVLLNSYDDNDIRKELFFQSSGPYQLFKGSYVSNKNVCFSGIATDEILLIRGECFVRTGQIQKGLNDLNLLLTNRYKPGTFTDLANLSQDDALNILLQERRKELLMRGLRWMDIKRLNKEGRNITPRRIIHGQVYELLPGSSYFALPIPDDIIKLTGIPQNT